MDPAIQRRGAAAVLRTRHRTRPRFRGGVWPGWRRCWVNQRQVFCNHWMVRTAAAQVAEAEAIGAARGGLGRRRRGRAVRRRLCAGLSSRMTVDPIGGVAFIGAGARRSTRTWRLAWHCERLDQERSSAIPKARSRSSCSSDAALRPLRSASASARRAEWRSPISSRAGTTRLPSGRKRHCACGRRFFPRCASWRRPTRSPEGRMKLGKQGTGCVSSRLPFGSQISGIGSPFADPMISPRMEDGLRMAGLPE